MTTILSNEEKLNIVNQHIRNVEYLQYNAQLDLIEANAVSSPDSAAISEINGRLSEIQNKLDALNEEKASLTE